MSIGSVVIDADVGIQSRSWYQRLFPPIDSPTNWHVSPVVDLFGYGFGWLVLAAPLYFALGAQGLEPGDYRVQGMAFIAMAVLLFDVHRHFTFPYIFLDRSVRQRFPMRIFLLPVLLIGLFTQIPFLSNSWTLLTAPGVAAVLAWIGLLFHALRHDGMGPAPRKRALLIGGGAALLAAALTTSSGSIPYYPWMMLLLPVGASLSLSALLFRSLGVRSGDGAAREFTDVKPDRGRSGVLPTCMIGLVVASGILTSVGGNPLVPVPTLVNGIFVVYVGWLLHHGMSQKYGILRLYSSKSGCSEKVPGSVDRWIAWCWVPMIFVWAAGSSPDAVRIYLDNQSMGASAFVSPILAFIQAHYAWTMAAAIAPIAGSLAAFLYYEWRIHQLRNMPRLGYVAGTMLLYASMFPLGSAGLYVALAASHSIEYMTFIWAFQRRRYAKPGSSSSRILEQMTKHPLLYFGTGTLFLASVFIFGRFVTRFGFEQMPYVAGFSVPAWLFWYSIVQAMIHFYYDGFLWKLRRPDLARSM